MRDYVGDVMAATCRTYNEKLKADVAEAFAARHALVIAWEAGLRRVVLETDCLKLFYHLQNKKKDNSSFGIIV
ncbi:Replicase polyprotein 1ab [Bienertia sinuspersici]